MNNLPEWLRPDGLLKPEQLHDYQKKAVNFQSGMPSSAIWLEMGLGKTIITLTSISHLIKSGYLKSVLIVAPIRVIRGVWRQEASKWSHTKDLSFSMITGTRDQRVRGLLRKADIYLINYENLRWLADTLEQYFSKKGLDLPFDGIVWDEISKMKNSTSKRVKAVVKILPSMKWLTGLTGTPASNGYVDLHGQFLVLDGGKRLGTSKDAFRNRFYYKAPPFKYTPFNDTEETIKKMIGDITLQMSTEDYLPLPDMVINDICLEMPEKLRYQYKALEDEFFTQLDNGTDIEVFNAAALTNKCLQFSNGNIYPISGSPEYENVHDLKLEALESIIEEANGKPVLVAYAYRSDADMIMKRFSKMKPINLTNCKSDKSLNDAMAKWANGECKLIIGHPLSMGFGVDGLQNTGNILVWFGLNWSLDAYEQFNARLRRQGQGAPVICHRILISGTLDEAQRIALDDKELVQNSLKDAIKKYRGSL